MSEEGGWRGGSAAPPLTPADGLRRLDRTVGVLVLTAVVLGLLAYAVLVAGAAPAAAFGVLALLPAATVDLREHRLPDRLVAVGGLTLLVALALATAGGEPWPTASVLAGLVAASSPLVFIHLGSPPAMGFGDVKASVVLGAAMGVVDWRLSIVMLMLAAGSAALLGLTLRVKTMAFGPALVASAGATLSVHDVALEALSS